MFYACGNFLPSKYTTVYLGRPFLFIDRGPVIFISYPIQDPVLFTFPDLAILWILGGYDMEEKGARAYDLAALKYWGPSTHTNFSVCLKCLLAFESINN